MVDYNMYGKNVVQGLLKQVRYVK